MLHKQLQAVHELAPRGQALGSNMEEIELGGVRQRFIDLPFGMDKNQLQVKLFSEIMNVKKERHTCSIDKAQLSNIQMDLLSLMLFLQERHQSAESLGILKSEGTIQLDIHHVGAKIDYIFHLETIRLTRVSLTFSRRY